MKLTAMESQYSHNQELAYNIISQLINACDLILIWNKEIKCSDDYLTSPEGMGKMAASCMIIESIGESVKKLDRLLPGFLDGKAPYTPWKEIKGLRDHIAHGYFDIDASIIYDVSVNEIPNLKKTFLKLQSSI